MTRYRADRARRAGQSEQALCLTVVTNAVVAWTEFLGLAVAELRSGGRHVDDEVLAHGSPAHNENIGFYGTFSFEVASELAQLGRRLSPAPPTQAMSRSASRLPVETVGSTAPVVSPARKRWILRRYCRYPSPASGSPSTAPARTKPTS